MFTRAIVRPPAPNFAEGLTTAGLGAPDYELALRQHDAYCAALEQCGLKLIRLDADPNYPDSCFVEDAAIVIPELAFQCPRVPTPTRVVLTRPGAASRAGEVQGLQAAFDQFVPELAIKQIKSPGTLDGGDVLEAGEHFFIGVSARTNESGAEQFAHLVAAQVYTSSLVDIRGFDSLLHLKSGLAYLGDNRLVVTEVFADGDEFSDFELVQTPRGEEYAANCLSVNDYVLIAAGQPKFANTLRQLGYRTIVIEMSEFQKMDGGLSCLSLRW